MIDEEYYKIFNRYLRRIYSGMKRRCNYPKMCNYHRYGGRGIKCLFKSADEFVDYVTGTLGIKYMSQIEGLQIDRINNDGNYEPGNIRFVTPKVNSNNHTNHIISIDSTARFRLMEFLQDFSIFD